MIEARGNNSPMAGGVAGGNSVQAGAGVSILNGLMFANDIGETNND